jgi:hypothetical protein
MRLSAWVFGVGSAVALWAAPRSALAFERQWHLGAGAGVSRGNGLALSPALTAYGAYGISDVFDVRVELTARGYQIADEHNPHALSAMAGLAYKLDVLSWVPWVAAYAGYQAFLQPLPPSVPFRRQDVAIGLGLGLDYGFSRDWGLGVTLHFDQALTKPESTSFDGLLRAEYRWGW